MNQAAELISEAADTEAEIIFGTAINPEMSDEVKITVIATGFERERANSLSGAKAQRRDSKSASLSKDKLGQMKAAAPPPGTSAPAASDDQEDDLDIPSFLRRRR